MREGVAHQGSDVRLRLCLVRPEEGPRLVIASLVQRVVAHLKDAIQRFLDAWNANKHPFAWVRTPDEVLHNAKPKERDGGQR